MNTDITITNLTPEYQVAKTKIINLLVENDIEQLKTKFPEADANFFDYVRTGEIYQSFDHETLMRIFRNRFLAGRSLISAEKV